VPYARESAEDFPRREARKNQDQEIAPSLPLLLYQWLVRDTPRAHFKGTLHQDLHKNRDFFWRNTRFLENFRPFSREKNLLHRSPLGLNHPCLLATTTAAKKYSTMVGKSSDVFTK